MGKLSKWRVDSAAIREGRWVKLDPSTDAEILTRGLTDAYADDQFARQKQAAKAHGGQIEDIPVAERRAINIECLIRHVVLDVRGLTDDDDQPVDRDKFYALLQHPDFFDLVTACYRAAGTVGQARQRELEDAVGNSPPASATSSTGADSAP